MKKYTKDMKNLVRAGVGLGVGGAVLGGMGSAGVGGASALGKAAPMLGVLGVASGASAVMRVVGGRRRR
jgi:hypothetical protein